MKLAEMLDKNTQTVDEPSESESSMYSDLEIEEESYSESSESADEEMYPNLSNGAIERILNGEDVPAVVLQIIGCKKIPGTLVDRYRLLISDGVTGCPYVMLGSQLNHMVPNLKKFTIVRVDKCVCHQVQPGRKVIILLHLTVLVPGNEVNEKLGNPILPQSPDPIDPAPTNIGQITPTNGRPPSMRDETRPIR